MRRAPSRGVRARSSRRLTLLSTVALLSFGLASCGAGATGPQAAASAFLGAWSRQAWSEAGQLVAHPPADFAAVNAAVVNDLGLRRMTFVTGASSEHGALARLPVTEHFLLRGFGTWVVRSQLTLSDRSGAWRVEWSPQTIDPSLHTGESLAVTTTWATRAPILGADGAPLTTSAKTVVIGVEGSYVKNPSQLTAALESAGATPSEVSSALGAAQQNPTYFEPVFTVGWARYLKLKPTLYPLPGTVFQTTQQREAITPGLEAHLVGAVGPITAEELRTLGAPYDASSVVGQTGLEQVDESQLAGQPGYTISVVNGAGVPVAVLARRGPLSGTPVQTSIDPGIQRAAEMALARQTKHAALVAVDAKTGQVLAAASDPVADGFDQALDGTFPPGSTFKTITSTALIEAGQSPSSPASCPSSITVGGEVFHNAEGDTPVQSLAGAFSESCNTAFIGLATKDLDPASLPAAAAEFGLGKSWEAGIPAFVGSVPKPADAADLASEAIGQGQVLVSPLDMAMVAAAIDAGVVHQPRLVKGSPDDAAKPRRLPAAVVSDLHQMMADVVTHGTAANEGLPAGTFAKTGTAEYGTGNPPSTDSWLIGFRGDIAFAVLVVDGGLGGPTCGPIAAQFLRAAGDA